MKPKAARSKLPAPGDWLTTKKVAEITGYDEQTVKGWRHRRVGPPWFRVGTGKNSIRYDRAELEAWCEQQRRRSA